jgi:hypothetical protein
MLNGGVVTAHGDGEPSVTPRPAANEAVIVIERGGGGANSSASASSLDTSTCALRVKLPPHDATVVVQAMLVDIANTHSHGRSGNMTRTPGL